MSIFEKKGEGKMRRGKRIAAFFLVAMLLGVSVESTVWGGETAIAATKKEKDYSAYSNTKYGWYIQRKQNHEKAGGGVPAGITLKKYQAYYMNTSTNENVMYLSFDCGYENGYTKKILKILKKHHAKAIFFVTKGFVTSNPELAKQMKKEGHLVGNHTCSHPSLPSKSASEIKNELRGCEKAFKQATGYDMDPYLRPPMGEFSQRTLKICQDLGYKTIFWSMAYHDYDVNDQPGKNYVLQHFKENYHKGALPLIHNTSKSNCEALDDVLTFLEGKKYRFGTVDEFTMKKGIIKISCADKIYDGKPAKIMVKKNTNKTVKVTYIIKNQDGKQVKQAIKPGTYTVVANVEATKTHRAAQSNKVKFTIKQQPKPTLSPAPVTMEKNLLAQMTVLASRTIYLKCEWNIEK